MTAGRRTTYTESSSVSIAAAVEMPQRSERRFLHDVLRFDSVAAVEADDVGPQGMGVLVVEGAKQVGVTPGHQSRAHAVCSPITRHGWLPDRQGVRAATLRRFGVSRGRRERGGMVIAFITHLLPHSERSVAFLTKADGNTRAQFMQRYVS